MRLPSTWKAAIDRELESVDRSRLARAAEQITSDYKSGQFGDSLSSAEARAAYLVTRLPATFAASDFVFREVERLLPELNPVSLLDLGAGPGTASWAAAEVWPSLQEITLIEGNREMIAVGKRMAAEHAVLQHANWVQGDLCSSELPKADVVVLSYTIGELANASSAVKAAWNAAQKLLVIVEPGTPHNFQQVLQIRSELIAAGGNVVAPCPHQQECPMAAANDWCHFAVRLERTAEHRRLKGGALGYEDEKFSYVVFSKQSAQRAEARIVRHPLTYSGYIRLQLCEPGGLREQTVTRSSKDRFRAARKAKWGDEWRQLE